jgi:hypothetical protein
LIVADLQLIVILRLKKNERLIQIMEKIYRIDFYVPQEQSDKVKEAMFNAGAGKIGNYDCCCWQTFGDGQFRALEGSEPFIGDKNKIEVVDELKIEIICNIEIIDAVIAAMKEAHPYETPSYQVLEAYI